MSVPSWPRAIILVDMNAFFASVEQYDNPQWRGQPVAITNGEAGTCIITCSYEARAYGIKTGMRLPEAKLLCPYLLTVPSHPYRYAEVSTRIMQSLSTLTPDIEIFSIDEAFLDVTGCQNLFGTPEQIGQLAKQKVWEASGLACSIGVSGDKTTAKFAAKLQKPNGFTVIPPWEAQMRLSTVPVTELCGIGTGIGRFLARYGVITCGDMQKLPISVIAKRFGNPGRRMWYMCQGLDPEPVHTTIASPQSMGHGKVMPPNTRDRKTLLLYLRHMCEKLALRLRRNEMVAQHFFIGWCSYSLGWLGGKCQLVYPSQDGKEFYQLGYQMLQQVWRGEGVYQIQVTALDPQIQNLQYDLFITPPDPRLNRLHDAIDQINERYGEFAIAPAPLLKRTAMHNVIAPSWKPIGHRQSL